MDTMEYTRAAPGTEISSPAPEFSARSAPEFAAPPPEFPKGLMTREEPTKQKKHRWQKLIAAVLVSVVGMGAFFGGKAKAAPDAGPVPGTEITAEGTVEFVLRYAELRDGTVHYSYYPFMPDPDDPEKMSGDIPLPIDVYARVTDAYGGSAAPAQEPDVWMASRGYLDYEIDAQPLQGELTLTLTALYTQDGEEKKTVLSVPVTAAEAEDTPTIDIGYAVTDGESVYFSYFINVPDFDLPEEKQQYWPITVHPIAEGADGQIAYGDTDVWEYPRVSQFAYEFPIWDEMADELTLKLTGEYERDGQTHTISAETPIEPLPPGEPKAFLWIQDDGTADFKATLTTSEDDPHAYDLEPMMLWAEAYNAEQQNMGDFWSLQDEAELERDYFAESGNQEFVFHRMGEIGEAPEGAKYCRFRFYMRDRSNGYIYQMQSNICPLPARTYPLGNEIIEIVVYNGTLTFDYPSQTDDDGYLTVLAHTQLNAADFTSYELPLALPPAGYTSSGYVVHFGNPLDNGYDAYDDYGGLVNQPPELTEDFSGEPPAEYYISEGMFAFPVNGLTLTKEMVERVPIGTDGVRYVNVHATWALSTGSPEFHVLLDDGQGNVTDYPVANPEASEGFFYTFTFPQPVPPMGYYFDGWYDENGKRVDFLMDYFSFTPYLYDSEGRFIGFDWSQSIPVKLIAHWLPY